MNTVMLACNKRVPLKAMRYPLLVSKKLDGNRLIIYHGQLLSRRLKLQKNKQLPIFLQKIAEYSRRNRVVFDGEFYSHAHHFTQVQSMRGHNWKPVKGFTYHIFDAIPEEEWLRKEKYMNFDARTKFLRVVLEAGQYPNVEQVEQKLCKNVFQALKLYNDAIENGYEGIILRSPDGMYKHGRATRNEGTMFKKKRFITTDAVITGFTERERLTDEYRNSDRGENEDGSRKRTSSKTVREKTGEIGATEVRLKNGTTTRLSLKKGVTYQQLGITWANRKKFIGKWVEFEYQPEGSLDRPRSGRVVRLRPDLD